MSWAEVKHAINSTLGTAGLKPLDTHITEQTQTVHTTLGQKADAAGTTGTSSLFSWVKSIFSAVTTNGTTSAIKRIQRGRHNGNGTAGDITITLPASVNPDKCLVLLNSTMSGNMIDMGGSNNIVMVYTAALVALSATTLVVSQSRYHAGGSSYAALPFSWQVVEYY